MLGWTPRWGLTIAIASVTAVSAREAAGSECASSPECHIDGRCELVDGACQATRDEDCRASVMCRDQGLCLMVLGTCVAGSDADCQGSRICREAGACSEHMQLCVHPMAAALVVPRVIEPCRDACREAGRCHHDGDHCVALRESDCQGAEICKEDGACFLDPNDLHCDDGTERNNTGMVVGGAISIGVGGFAGVMTGLFAFLYSFSPKDDGRTAALVGVGLAGGTLFSAGIPLTAVGNLKVRRTTDTSRMPTFVLSPRGVVVRWRF